MNIGCFYDPDFVCHGNMPRIYDLKIRNNFNCRAMQFCHHIVKDRLEQAWASPVKSTNICHSGNFCRFFDNFFTLPAPQHLLSAQKNCRQYDWYHRQKS